MHDSGGRTHTVLTEFEKQRKRMYCTLPLISHQAMDVPAEVSFHCQRRRLLEHITRSSNNQAPMERTTITNNGPQVGEAVASVTRLVHLGLLNLP